MGEGVGGMWVSVYISWVLNGCVCVCESAINALQMLPSGARQRSWSLRALVGLRGDSARVRTGRDFVRCVCVAGFVCVCVFSPVFDSKGVGSGWLIRSVYVRMCRSVFMCVT